MLPLLAHVPLDTVTVPLLPTLLPRVPKLLLTLPPVTLRAPAPLPPTVRCQLIAHVPFATVTVPLLPTFEPRKLSLLVTLPPFTVKRPVPLLPILRNPLPDRICSNPADTLVVMSRTTVFAGDVAPFRLSVPVFVSESVPVPEIVLLIVRAPVWFHWSVPLSMTSPVTVAPSFKSTVSPGSIVPPA